MKNNNQGGFLTGFIVGMLAGGAGLFLFGTEDGRKVRKSLNKEWDKAKEKMAEEGVIENSSLSLRDIIGSVFEKIGENVAESQKPVKKTQKTSRKIPASKKQKPTPKKKRSLKFKGV